MSSPDYELAERVGALLVERATERDYWRERAERAERLLRAARPFVEAEYEATDDGGYFAILEEIDAVLASRSSDAHD